MQLGAIRWAQLSIRGSKSPTPPLTKLKHRTTLNRALILFANV
jgi:hypothetical protein